MLQNFKNSDKHLRNFEGNIIKNDFILKDFRIQTDFFKFSMILLFLSINILSYCPKILSKSTQAIVYTIMIMAIYYSRTSLCLASPVPENAVRLWEVSNF